MLSPVFFCLWDVLSSLSFPCLFPDRGRSFLRPLLSTSRFSPVSCFQVYLRPAPWCLLSGRPPSCPCKSVWILCLFLVFHVFLTFYLFLFVCFVAIHVFLFIHLHRRINLFFFGSILLHYHSAFGSFLLTWVWQNDLLIDLEWSQEVTPSFAGSIFLFMPVQFSAKILHA